MSVDVPPSRSLDVLNVQRQRLAMTLRQIADKLDQVPGRKLADVLPALSGPSDELFRIARFLIRRAFGE